MKIYNIFVAKVTNIIDIIGRKAQIQTIAQNIESKQQQVDNITIVSPKGLYTTTTVNDNITVQTLADGELIGYANNGIYTKTQIEGAYQATNIDTNNIEDMFLGGVIGSTRIIVKQSDNSITLTTANNATIQIDTNGNITLNTNGTTTINSNSTLNGNLNITGNLVVSGTSDFNGGSKTNGKQNAVIGGTTMGNATTQTITTSGQ